MYSKPNYLTIPGVLANFHRLFPIYATLHHRLYLERYDIMTNKE